MKVIPTNYGGVLFRSRLEAKWALFFDLVGVRREYEAEGFELDDGTRYLPDFVLRYSDGWCYAEIKPSGDPFEKARKFAAECSHAICLLAGDPSGMPFSILQKITLPDEEGVVSSRLLEMSFTFHKGRPWSDPSPGDCAHAVEVAALVRSHRFWDPRRTA